MKYVKTSRVLRFFFSSLLPNLNKSRKIQRWILIVWYICALLASFSVIYQRVMLVPSLEKRLQHLEVMWVSSLDAPQDPHKFFYTLRVEAEHLKASFRDLPFYQIPSFLELVRQRLDVPFLATKMWALDMLSLHCRSLEKKMFSFLLFYLSHPDRHLRERVFQLLYCIDASRLFPILLARAKNAPAQIYRRESIEVTRMYLDAPFRLILAYLQLFLKIGSEHRDSLGAIGYHYKTAFHLLQPADQKKLFSGSHDRLLTLVIKKLLRLKAEKHDSSQKESFYAGHIYHIEHIIAHHHIRLREQIIVPYYLELFYQKSTFPKKINSWLPGGAYLSILSKYPLQKKHAEMIVQKAIFWLHYIDHYVKNPSLKRIQEGLVYTMLSNLSSHAITALPLLMQRFHRKEKRPLNRLLYLLGTIAKISIHVKDKNLALRTLEFWYSILSDRSRVHPALKCNQCFNIMAMQAMEIFTAIGPRSPSSLSGILSFYEKLSREERVLFYTHGLFLVMAQMGPCVWPFFQRVLCEKDPYPKKYILLALHKHGRQMLPLVKNLPRYCNISKATP